MLYVGIDTALVNAGLVVLSYDGTPFFAGKPFPKKEWKGDEDSLFLEHRRIREIASWVCSKVEYARGLGRGPNVFVAMEDYLLTGYQRSYKTAELNAVLKEKWHDQNVPYCLVHPSKTHKYVVKKKDVTKTEIIAFVNERCPLVLEMVDRADYSDIADAWVIAQIGRMVYEAMSAHGPDVNPVIYTERHPLWEERWKELLATDKSGILTKPGLVKWSY